jgi:hypothetical protein
MKFAKVLIIVCVTLLVFLPWVVLGKRDRQKGSDPGSNDGSAGGQGDR